MFEKFLIKILVTTVNAFILAYILPGIEIADIWSAFLVAIGLALLNATIKPLLIVLTLPVTLLTLGLFLLVINACIILLDDEFVHGFTVDGFWSALLFSICLSFFNSFVHKKAFASKTVKEEEN